jgi:hypothetical protein
MLQYNEFGQGYFIKKDVARIVCDLQRTVSQERRTAEEKEFYFKATY